MKPIHVVPALALSALVLTASACGSQTDARVSDAASAAPSAPVETAPPASTEAAPSQEAPAAPNGAYVSVDCATGQQSAGDAAPTGTTVADVTASLNADGVPTITVASMAAPAQTLQSADLVVGTGPDATPADVLTVDYCGVGLGSKALFDSSWQHGQPATFPLNGVIAGWQQGVPGMKVGGSRLLVIPGALAYGTNPPPGSGIGSDETLIFVVTLHSISK